MDAEIASRYHERAAADGTRIIPACGFDSVPSDLGTLLMTRYFRDMLGIPCAEVRGNFKFSGGLNGGTVASLLNMLNAPRRKVTETTPKPRGGRIRMVTAPRYDAELGAWIGPFIMAPTNTHVVRRSATLFEEWQEPYGPKFVYQEAMRYDAPFGRARAIAASAGLGLMFAALKQPLARRMILPLLPKPGTGPSVEKMDAGWFTCDLLGLAEDGRQVRGLIRYDGDPGNRATTVLVCESALSLALSLAIDVDAAHGGRARGGVLTPATGLGDVLVERLRKAGVVIEIPSSRHRRA